jgi:hypothetical protein
MQFDRLRVWAYLSFALSLTVVMLFAIVWRSVLAFENGTGRKVKDLQVGKLEASWISAPTRMYDILETHTNAYKLSRGIIDPRETTHWSLRISARGYYYICASRESSTDCAPVVEICDLDRDFVDQQGIAAIGSCSRAVRHPVLAFANDWFHPYSLLTLLAPSN